jgi:hypothetical protein
MKTKTKTKNKSAAGKLCKCGTEKRPFKHFCRVAYDETDMNGCPICDNHCECCK